MDDTESLGRILVVDDDLDFAKFACTVFEGLGYRTAVAWTGRDAVQRTGEAAWAGVLLDVGLPDMTGLDVLQRILSHDLTARVAVVTGMSTVDIAVKAMKLGAVDYFEKPVSLAGFTTMAQDTFAVRSPQSAVRSPQSAVPPVGGSFVPPPRHSVVHRLVDDMVAVVECAHDVPTVRAWGGLLRKSESYLHTRCAVVGLSAKAALDLARCLRAAWVGVARLEDAFDAADARTIARLFGRLGATDAATGCSVADILDKQQIVTDVRVVQALSARLVPDLGRLEKIP